MISFGFKLQTGQIYAWDKCYFAQLKRSVAQQINQIIKKVFSHNIFL